MSGAGGLFKLHADVAHAFHSATRSTRPSKTSSEARHEVSRPRNCACQAIDHGDRLIRTVKVDRDGSFRAPLKAGTYWLQPPDRKNARSTSAGNRAQRPLDHRHAHRGTLRATRPALAPTTSERHTRPRARASSQAALLPRERGSLSRPRDCLRAPIETLATHEVRASWPPVRTHSQRATRTSGLPGARRALRAARSRTPPRSGGGAVVPSRRTHPSRATAGARCRRGFRWAVRRRSLGRIERQYQRQRSSAGTRVR
jgi:hypothetical protein